MRSLFATVFFVALSSLAALAQTVRWDPPGGQLGFNQVSELALTFEGCEPEGGGVTLPAVDGLVFGRPNVSQSSSFSFGTGGRSSLSTYSLNFPVRPTKRSKISIPAFDIKTDKGMLHVAAANYAVGDATVGNSSLAVKDISSAKLTVGKDSIWAGEVVPVTYTLNVVRRYFHSLASNVDWQAAPFSTEDWSKPEPVETLVRGERTVVSTQTSRLLAREPGSFTLKPTVQMVNLMVGTNSGFGLFAQQPPVEQVSITSEPLTLTVNPLPPAPPEFSKAVGQFTLVSKIVPTTAAPGEPITWTIELSGTGNWPDLAGLPQREVSSDFQAVQPKAKRTMKDGALFEGSLSEDVVLVPTKTGRYTLGPIKFTYFDTKAGTYRTLSTEAATVTITAPGAPPPAAATGPVQFSLNGPAAVAPAATVVNSVPPVPPEALPRDPLPGAERGVVPFRSVIFWLAATVPAAVLTLLAWLGLATLRSRQRDPQRLRREAHRALAVTLAELRSGSQLSALNSQLRVWQLDAARLWQIPHAAPGAPRVAAAIAARPSDGAAEWAKLWEEADRAQHARNAALPADWLARAEAALQAVRVPDWPAFSLLAPRNLLPFLFSILLLSALSPQLSAMGSDAAAEHYKRADFPAAESAWRKTTATDPSNWTAQHNLGLALAQQERWAEATAHWTSAFLLSPRTDAVRWDLALGLQRSGMAPPELVEFSRGEGRYELARSASPGEWQLVLVGASLLIALALIVLLLKGYGRIGAWARPVALATILVAMLLAAAATFSLHSYGQLAAPDVALVWKPSTLRSIPTEADTAQKTSPLSAGSIAVADKNFLGWSRLTFAGGQQGWVRTEDLIKLYR